MDLQNRLSVSFRVMHPRVTRSFAVSQHRSVEEVLGAGPIARVKLDRAIDGHQPSSSTSICSSVCGGTGGVLPELYRMTSAS